VPDIGLPSSKMISGEVPVLTMRRWCASHSCPYPALDFTKRAVEVMERPSMRYNIRTRYVRTVFSAKLRTLFAYRESVEHDQTPLIFEDGWAMFLAPLIMLRSTPDAAGSSKAHLCAWMGIDDLDQLNARHDHSTAVVRAWLRPEWLHISSPLNFNGGTIEDMLKACSMIQYAWRYRRSPWRRYLQSPALNKAATLIQRGWRNWHHSFETISGSSTFIEVFTPAPGFHTRAPWKSRSRERTNSLVPSMQSDESCGSAESVPLVPQTTVRAVQTDRRISL